METMNLKTTNFAFASLVDVQGIAMRDGGGVPAESAGLAYGLKAQVNLLARAAEHRWSEPTFAATPRPKGAVGKVSTEHLAT